jgi:glucan 1,3-beta-glucosidase
MVDNSGNTHGAAPDKGSMNGPVFNQNESESFLVHENSRRARKNRRSGDFWMDSISHGEMLFAPDGYQFYRNIMDFGATGDGVTDDTEAINRAVSWYSTTDSTLRCGEACGSTSVLGALVYFPVS